MYLPWLMLLALFKLDISQWWLHHYYDAKKKKKKVSSAKKNILYEFVYCIKVLLISIAVWFIIICDLCP